MQTVTVTTAIELTAAQRTAVQKTAAAKLGATKFELKEVVNPKILGGLTLQIGSRLYDASVQSQLESLRQ